MLTAATCFLVGLVAGTLGSIAIVALAIAHMGSEARPDYDDSVDAAVQHERDV